MKKRIYLTAPRILEMWDIYNETLSFSVTAEKLGVSYANVRNWVRDIERGLTGVKVNRVKGKQHLKTVLKILKNKEEEKSNIQKETTSPASIYETVPYSTSIQLPPEDVEARVERLWNELKEAVSDLALQLADERSKELVEAAQRSNLVGLIKQKWSTRT